MTDERHVDPIAALGRLAAAPVDASQERIDVLGERIDAAIADDDDGAMVIPLVPRRRRRAVTAGLAAACVLLVIVAGAALLRPSDESIVIAFADGVTVTLDDGSTLDGTSGLELADGATLDVEGSVVIGGERFGPGTYRVDGGELEPIGEQPSATVPTGDPDDGSGEVPATAIPSPTSTTIADADEVAPVIPEPGDGDVGDVTATTDLGATSATRPSTTDATTGATTTMADRTPDDTRPVDRTTVPTTDGRPATTTPETRPATTTATTTTEATRPTDETRPERTTTTTTQPPRDR